MTTLRKLLQKYEADELIPTLEKECRPILSQEIVQSATQNNGELITDYYSLYYPYHLTNEIKQVMITHTADNILSCVLVRVYTDAEKTQIVEYMMEA